MSTLQGDVGIAAARQQLVNAVKLRFGEIIDEPDAAFRRDNVTACYDSKDGVYRLDVEAADRVQRYDVRPDPNQEVRTRFRGQMTPAHYSDETESGIYLLIKRINAVAHLPGVKVERAR